MLIEKFLFRQIATNYKVLAITGRSPAVVHAADAKKIRKNKSGFSLFYNFILFDDATATKNAFFLM